MAKKTFQKDVMKQKKFMLAVASQIIKIRFVAMAISCKMIVNKYVFISMNAFT